MHSKKAKAIKDMLEGIMNLQYNDDDITEINQYLLAVRWSGQFPNGDKFILELLDLLSQQQHVIHDLED